MTDVIPGVEIFLDGECAAVHISDKDGEVVMWNFEELEEDPSAWTASLHAVILAATSGAPAVRKQINGGMSDEEAVLRRAWHHLDEAISAIYEARFENRGGMGQNLEGLNGALRWLGEELEEIQ